jgi:hypothetical protein
MILLDSFVFEGFSHATVVAPNGSAFVTNFSSLAQPPQCAFHRVDFGTFQLTARDLFFG